jgi:hypothetical protein
MSEIGDPPISDIRGRRSVATTDVAHDGFVATALADGHVAAAFAMFAIMLAITIAADAHIELSQGDGPVGGRRSAGKGRHGDYARHGGNGKG